MDNNFETYVTRINYTLENLIAPQIEQDYIRSQVFAIMELLHQLTSRLEYRHELLLDDIERLRGILKTLIEPLSKYKIHVQEELLKQTKISTDGKYGRELKEIHDKMEVSASSAIDLLFENRHKIGNVKEIEQQILGQISDGIIRDVMLFKPEMIHEIAKKYQHEEE